MLNVYLEHDVEVELYYVDIRYYSQLYDASAQSRPLAAGFAIDAMHAVRMQRCSIFVF